MRERELVAARLRKFNYPEFAEQVWMPSECFSYTIIRVEIIVISGHPTNTIADPEPLQP